jgi:Mannosyltransferase (PIG-V)
VDHPPQGWSGDLRAAWSAFWPSRLVAFGAAIWVTVAAVAPAAVSGYPALEHPFEPWPATDLLDLVLSPLSKWDALHYMAISLDGYTGSEPGLPSDERRAAFFPLYPGLVRVLSGFAASPGLVVIVAYAVSLACFLAALTLLHRLVTIELGVRFARPTLMLLAFFPTAFFFGIPYTESLFLLLAVAAFLAARTGRWAVAGVVVALASATRAPGLLLLVPVLLLYLYGPRADREPAPGGGLRPRHRIGPEVAWLALAPLGLVAFSAYLHFALGDALAWQSAQELFGRQTVDPFTGIWDGLREGGASLADVVSGEYRSQPVFAHLNIAQLLAVAFAVVGGVGALRLLPPAYGVWVLVSLLPILLSQAPTLPLYSSTRFVAVLFPLFLWLAVVCERRGATTAVTAVFAAGMAVLTVQFTLWYFVA